MRHEKVQHFAPVGGGPKDKLPRNDAVHQDLLVAVDIGEEHVERLQALGQPRLDRRPFCRRYDPGQKISGNDPLGRALGPVHCESDALQQEEALEQTLAFREVFVCKRGNAPGEGRVVRPHLSRRIHHLVVGIHRRGASAGRMRRIGQSVSHPVLPSVRIRQGKSLDIERPA